MNNRNQPKDVMTFFGAVKPNNLHYKFKQNGKEINQYNKINKFDQQYEKEDKQKQG